MPEEHAGTIPYRPLLPARGVAAIAFVWVPAMDLLDSVRLGLGGVAVGWSLAALGVALVVRAFVGFNAFSAERWPAAMAWLCAGSMVMGLPPLLHATLPWTGLGVALNGVFVLRLLADLAVGPGAILSAVALCVAVWPCIAADSHEAADRAVLAGTAWIVATVLGMKAHGVFTSSWRPEHQSALLLETVPPLALSGLAIARIVLRRRWLRAVRAGKVDGWALQALRGDESEEDLPLLLGGETDESWHASTLTFVRPHRREPVALVPASWRWPLRRAPVVAVLAVLPAPYSLWTLEYQRSQAPGSTTHVAMRDDGSMWADAPDFPPASTLATPTELSQVAGLLAWTSLTGSMRSVPPASMSCSGTPDCNDIELDVSYPGHVAAVAHFDASPFHDLSHLLSTVGDDVLEQAMVEDWRDRLAFRLGRRWKVSEGTSVEAVWTRRGDSRVFDVVWHDDTAHDEGKDTVQVTGVRRVDPAHVGIAVVGLQSRKHYAGTVQADDRSQINGNAGEDVPWSATVEE